MCFLFKVTCQTGSCLKANYSGLLVSRPGSKGSSLLHPGQRKKSKWATKEDKVYHPYLKATGIPFTTNAYLLQNNGNHTQELGPCVQLNTGPKLIYQEASQIQVPATPNMALYFPETQSQSGNESQSIAFPWLALRVI